MTDPQIDMARGRRAKELLDNELLQEAFDTIEKNAIAEWRNSKDNDFREAVWYRLNGLMLFKRYLTEVVNDGTMARANAAQEQPRPA